MGSCAQRGFSTKMRTSTDRELPYTTNGAVSSYVGKLLRRSRYRLLGLVGQGQFGRVYCAVHRKTGQLVALKNLEQQRFPTHKFLRELRFLLSLQHPNIVTCQSIEHSHTGRYLVMDYCEGGTLRGLMESEGRLHPVHCLKLAIDILKGLEHAHSRGIVHCDIKPENILLSVQSAGWTARISDFGIARLHQELAEPQSGSNTGSPAYMAPERFYGQYSPTSDLYAVGILLYELLSGDRPFSGTPVELRAAHLNQPLIFPDCIPDLWRPILATALQKLAGRRYRTATEMLSAVGQLQAQESIAKTVLPSSSPQSLIPHSRPLLVPNPFPAIPVVAKQQVMLESPLHAVAPAMTGSEGLPKSLELYCARGENVIRRVVDLSGEGCQEQSTQMEAPVKALHCCDRGCLAVTANAVFLLFRSPTKELSTHLVAPLRPESIVAATGRWVAMVQTNTGGSAETLDVLSLWGGGGKRQGIPLFQQGRLPFRGTAEQTPQNLHLSWLDTRHLAIIDHSNSAGEIFPGDWRPQITVFTRRGQRLCEFKLPVPLSRVVPTSVAHRLLGIDSTDPQSVLLIDLMPYRICRIGLEIFPHCLTATPWGSAIADPQGTLILLDHQGQRLGKLATGLPTTAVMSLHSRCLGIVSAEEHPALHLLDLTQPPLELTF